MVSTCTHTESEKLTMLDLNDSSKSRGSEQRYLLAYVGRHGKCRRFIVMSVVQC
jgi:hypothetical protein